MQGAVISISEVVSGCCHLRCLELGRILAALLVKRMDLDRLVIDYYIHIGIEFVLIAIRWSNEWVSFLGLKRALGLVGVQELAGLVIDRDHLRLVIHLLSVWIKVNGLVLRLLGIVQDLATRLLHHLFTGSLPVLLIVLNLLLLLHLPLLLHEQLIGGTVLARCHLFGSQRLRLFLLISCLIVGLNRLTFYLEVHT